MKHAIELLKRELQYASLDGMMLQSERDFKQSDECREVIKDYRAALDLLESKPDEALPPGFPEAVAATPDVEDPFAADLDEPLGTPQQCSTDDGPCDSCQ